jgi:type II secretory pathway component PulK
VALITAMIVAAVTVTLATALTVRQQRDIQRVSVETSAAGIDHAMDEALRLALAEVFRLIPPEPPGVDMTRRTGTETFTSERTETEIVEPAIRDRPRGSVLKLGPREVQRTVSETLERRTEETEVSRRKRGYIHDIQTAGELGSWRYRVQISDPQRLLNLNALADPAARPIVRDRLDRLFRSLDIDAGLLNALTDWVDEDADRRHPGGAEDDVYTRLDPPYRAANAPLGRLDELRLVLGFSDEVIKQLSPYVTVLPVSAGLNVNTADELVLRTLHDDLDAEIATEIVRRRELDPFPSVEAFVALLASFDVPMINAGLVTHNDHLVSTVAISGEAGARVERIELIREPGGYRVFNRFAEDI